MLLFSLYIIVRREINEAGNREMCVDFYYV